MCGSWGRAVTSRPKPGRRRSVPARAPSSPSLLIYIMRLISRASALCKSVHPRCKRELGPPPQKPWMHQTRTRDAGCAANRS